MSSGPPGAADPPVYLDHAASTPMRRAAIDAMTEAFSIVGNASSLHGSGRAARRRVEESRESIAADLGARPSEVVFTAGGTESDNLAVKGIFRARRTQDPARRRIVASEVEHHAVLDAVQWLERYEAAEVTWLPVDAEGRVRPQDLRAELTAHAEQTALVTVMWANNEVGTIMPIAGLAAVAAEFDVPMHSDAVQAVGHLPVDFAGVPLAALSLAGHKFGGPHGAGALLLRREVRCEPILHGGGHERDVRSGTSDTPAVSGMAAALREAAAEAAEARPGRGTGATAALRDQLIAEVRRIAPDAVLNGAHPDGRLPGNAHFTFPGCEGDSLLMLLDAKGIECSTGSACTAGVARPSHVLTAMGVDPIGARGSLRFSLGYTSTAEDVEALVTVLPEALERARAAGLSSLAVREVNG